MMSKLAESTNVPMLSVDITRHTFLATPQEFLARHFPDDPGWQLLERPLTYEEWLKR
jgi:hypothetical protein